MPQDTHSATVWLSLTLSVDVFFFEGDIAGGCKLLRNRFESKDREWASYTCVLGFHVIGECCTLTPQLRAGSCCYGVSN